MKRFERLVRNALSAAALWAAAVALFVPARAAAAAEVPDVVLKGLQEYQTAGPDAALKAWLKGSALETSPEAQSQANAFRQVESMYGKYVGYHVIKVKELVPTCSLVFLVIEYEKGPLFAFITAYKGTGGWLITNMNWNTKAEAVLPESVLGE